MKVTDIPPCPGCGATEIERNRCVYCGRVRMVEHEQEKPKAFPQHTDASTVSFAGYTLNVELDEKLGPDEWFLR